ncbi:MAG: enolase C-terminal domain-like protein [Paracoccaceae bacterium]
MNEIKKIDVFEFNFPVENLGEDGFDSVYCPGKTKLSSTLAIRIETQNGLAGEYVGGTPMMMSQINAIAPKMIGESAFNRLNFYEEFKRALRKFDKVGVGPLDNALWDWAGRRLEVSVAELLGASRKKIPVYASTYHGDENGGLETPEDYAKFAEHCHSLGYTGFKIHGWTNGNVAREVEAVLLLGERVGKKMKLMLDPACHLVTFADALEVGRACDAAGFYWYEDPFRDTGVAQTAHLRLRELIKTPILIGEHVRGLEAKTNLALSGASDFVRVNPDLDMGITGALKVAHMAEGLGLDVEVHAAGPAHRQCVAAFRNANFYERALVGPKCGGSKPKVYTCGYSEELEAIDSDGMVDVPDGIGLGVEYDWVDIKSKATKHHVFS